MLRRVALLAAGVNAVWLVMFLVLGAPLMAAISLLSIGLYIASYALIGRRRNRAGIALIWLEVFAHAVFGSLTLGWNSGYHVFLLLFIPALVVGTPRRQARAGTAVVIAVYLGLNALCEVVPPLNPLAAWKLDVTFWVNTALAFAMFYAVADFYRQQVRAAERRLLEMATVDPLTGLANRAQFHLRATAAMADSAATAQPMALVLADVDYFKRINDEHGHDAGDKVLVRLAELMRRELSDGDVLARWGGEEFLALLPMRDGSSAAAVAERVRQAVAAVQIEVGGRMINVTMSFGVATVTPGQDLQRATLRADHALYASKRAGRNRVTCEGERGSAPETAEDAPEPALLHPVTG
jgi:diguanylate cyclase (GGDEF)-like protein